MWIVDAEDADAALAPEHDDVAQRRPELGPRLGFEVDRIDVLILLRRVLGVFDRAIRAMTEPLGVLLHPRVVGRALIGEVECHLESLAPGGRAERLEIVERAKPWIDRRMSALGRADRPRASRVLGRRGQRVVAALSMRCADRVYRWEVDNVEAHRGNCRQPTSRFPQRAAARWIGTIRTWKELVPGARARAHTLDPCTEGGRRRGVETPIRSRHVCGQVFLKRRGDPLRLAGRAREDVRCSAQLWRQRGLAPICRVAQQLRALQQLARDVEAALMLLPQRVAPRGELVDPRHHGVLPPPEVGQVQRGRPRVVDQRR